MADINNFNETQENTVSGVEPVKKRKGAVIGGITAGALVLVVGGGAAAYGLSDFVKNQVKLRISKPENYAAWVYEKNASEMASQLSESYKLSLERSKKGQTADFSLKYELSDDVKSQLGELIGEDDEFYDVLNGINDIKIGASGTTKDSVSSGTVYAEKNGENIVTYDFAADTAAMDIFMRLPELTEKWLVVENSEELDVNDSYEALQNAMKDPESVISPEELEKEIEKYVGIYNDCITDVQLEKKENITINDIDVNYSVVSVEITEQKASEIAEAFITAAKDDEILKRIFVEKTEIMTEDEYNEALDDALEDLKADEDDGVDNAIIVKTYIDASGCIRGFGAADKDDTDNEMRAVIGKDGNAVRGEFYFKDSEMEMFRADLAMEENDETYTGGLVMTADDEKVCVDFTDLKVENKEMGYVSGGITVTVPEIEPISLALTSDGSSQQISADIVVEGTDYGKLTVELAVSEGSDVTLPDKADAFVLDEELDISDYVDQEKMESFIADIMKKLGMSEEAAKEYAGYIADDMYYSYDDEDFGYDEDFGGWDDDEDFTFDGEDDDLTIDDDEDDDDYFDPSVYSENSVVAKDGEMFIAVLDEDMTSMYLGGTFAENLSYNAKNAKITGDGTYTVSVTADTDEYREQMGKDEKPEGLYMLSMEVLNAEGIENADITIDSLKIDGKEIKVSGTPYVESDSECYAVLLYVNESGEDLENMFDGESVGEWTDIEITFTIKGMK